MFDQRASHRCRPFARAVLAGAVALSTAAFAAAPWSGRPLPAHADAAVDTIVVDPSAVARTIPPTFFGVNAEGFWDAAQGSAASAVALAQTPIRSVRFAGGVPADYYDWQYPTCYGWSHTSPASLWSWAHSLGLRSCSRRTSRATIPRRGTASPWTRRATRRTSTIRNTRPTGSPTTSPRASRPKWRSATRRTSPSPAATPPPNRRRRSPLSAVHRRFQCAGPGHARGGAAG